MNQIRLTKALNFLVYGSTITSLLIITNGCTSLRTELSRTTADWSNRSAQIICYSGGRVIYSGRSDGKVFSESNSDGYTFIAADDRKLKEVSGDCIIKYD